MKKLQNRFSSNYLYDKYKNSGDTLEDFMTEIEKISDNYEVFEANASQVYFLSFVYRNDNEYFFYKFDRESVENFQFGNGIKADARIKVNDPQKALWLDDMIQTSGLMMVNKETNRFYTISQMALVPLATTISAGGFGKERGKLLPSPIRDLFLAEAFFKYENGKDRNCQWIAKTEEIGNIKVRKVFFVTKGHCEDNNYARYVAPDMRLLEECAEKILGNPDYFASVKDWQTSHKVSNINFNITLQNGLRRTIRIKDSDIGLNSFWVYIDNDEDETLFKKSWVHRKRLQSDEILSLLNSEIQKMEMC